MAARKDPKLRFLTWDMEPGDMLTVQPRTLHYSHLNPTDDWRVAVSVRVLGGDIRWDLRPDCVNLADVSFDEMLNGEKPQGTLFPLVWSEDGRREGRHPQQGRIFGIRLAHKASQTDEGQPRVVAAGHSSTDTGLADARSSHSQRCKGRVSRPGRCQP